MPPKKSSNGSANSGEHHGEQKGDTGQHQHQAGTTTDREEDQWKHREPYKVHENDADFKAVWNAGCHCGKVKYQLSREKPLSAKYCHCTTCQRLHGSCFQWAVIFHKSDINFTHGHHDLGWYDPSNKDISHHLPCKVSCSYCRTPIMDEGRNMILLFPTLIEGIQTPKGRAAFAATCHMFYNERVVDFVGDGAVKWEGLDNKSNLLDDHGNVLVEWKEGMEKEEMETLKRKRVGELEAEKEGTGKKAYKGRAHELVERNGNGHDLRSSS
jgi:hypothetical protein